MKFMTAWALFDDKGFFLGAYPDETLAYNLQDSFLKMEKGELTKISGCVVKKCKILIY